MSHNPPLANETIDLNGVVFSHQDIFNVVDDFYTRIQNDPILQVPFQSVGDWPEHIERLTHFWWIKFGGRHYMMSHYNPVMKHFFAGFNRELLNRWLSIFHETLKTHLNSDQVALWKAVSERIGEGLSLKNEMIKQQYQNAGSKPNEE